MKKEYVSPQAEVISFVPDEQLANSFWNTWGAAGVNPMATTPTSAADPELGDIEIELP